MLGVTDQTTMSQQLDHNTSSITSSIDLISTYTHMAQDVVRTRYKMAGREPTTPRNNYTCVII